MEKQERKTRAIEFLKKLDIYKPYIDGYESEDKICLFERFAGFWAYQYPELMEKVQEIENRYDCTVYAVTHEYTSFGECYDFLLVTHYDEEADDLLYNYDGVYYAYAYVWNKTDDWCSEFGTIGLKSFGGGITRIA